MTTMGTSEKLLKHMRHNQKDWRIEELESVAAANGLKVRKPGGSHVIFQRNGCPLAVSVPAHKPIKPVYIRKFLELLDWDENMP